MKKALLVLFCVGILKAVLTFDCSKFSNDETICNLMPFCFWNNPIPNDELCPNDMVFSSSTTITGKCVFDSCLLNTALMTDDSDTNCPSTDSCARGYTADYIDVDCVSAGSGIKIYGNYCRNNGNLNGIDECFYNYLKKENCEALYKGFNCRLYSTAGGEVCKVATKAEDTRWEDCANLPVELCYHYPYCHIAIDIDNFKRCDTSPYGKLQSNVVYDSLTHTCRSGNIKGQIDQDSKPFEVTKVDIDYCFTTTERTINVTHHSEYECLRSYNNQPRRVNKCYGLTSLLFIPPKWSDVWSSGLTVPWSYYNCKNGNKNECGYCADLEYDIDDSVCTKAGCDVRTLSGGRKICIDPALAGSSSLLVRSPSLIVSLFSAIIFSLFLE